MEEDPEGDTKYSIEVDASVRMTTADRLSHIPQVPGSCLFSLSDPGTAPWAGGWALKQRHSAS